MRYRASCFMNIAASENQSSCDRKRRRSTIDEEHSTIAAISSQPQKRTKTSFQPRRKANTANWDSLTKIWLTRDAVKEQNRRNRQLSSSVKTEIIRRPGRSEESIALKDCSPQLKRFARHGGPDLRDLRGVSSTQMMSR